MSRDVILARNALDPTCWIRHENVANLTEFLQENIGPTLSPHTRFYQGSVDGTSDVTPFDAASAEALEALPGPLFVVCYPESPGQIAVNVGLLIVSLVVGEILRKSPKDPGHPPKQGSANNALADRQNTARVLGRIPDIFGKVRATPDLIAAPFITYAGNLEVELSAMCLGAGTYDVNPAEVFEGDSVAQNIALLSIEVYPPGQLPGVGTPQITIGSAIGREVQTITKIEAVNGQILTALNELTQHGTIPTGVSTDVTQDPNLVGLPYAFIEFFYDPISNPNIAFISIPTKSQIPGDISAITDAISIGDTLEVRADPTGITKRRSGRFNDTNFNAYDQTGYVLPVVNLADDNFGYNVLNITSATRGTAPFAYQYADIEIAIPAPKLADWSHFTTFCAGQPLRNAATLVTPIFRNGRFVNEVGPFFVNDPNMTSLSLNFVADNGLFADDGNNIDVINIDITVRVAPADATGSAIGATEEQTFTVIGSLYDLSTRALTAVFVPGTFAGGRCLVSCMRVTQSYWRVEDPGQGPITTKNATVGVTLRGDLNPIGGTEYPRPSAFHWDPVGYAPPGSGIPAPGIYKQVNGTIEDTVRWTHLYSIADTGVTDYGDVTLVVAQTTQQRGTRSTQNSRKTSMLCTRKTNLWNGTAFVGPLQSNLLGRDTFFAILKDPLLGNIPDAQIDFPGIAAAFGAVDAYFGDFATNFGTTFDSENYTLEDMLSRVAQSCFCTAYREGGIIKVKPKIAQDNAVVLFNHRNMLPGSETRTVAFGTEADYDGAKIDYADDAGNTIKTLIVPSLATSSRPLEVSVTGIRDPVRAAFHAWRAYNHILYQNTRVEFNALSEAALCLIDDKILVADTTRPETISGEIVGVSGLILTTSQDIPAATGGTLFLQHTDGTVEGIAAFFLETRQIALFSAPSVPLVTDPNAGVRTGYTLVQATDARSRGFLLEQKSAQSTMTWQLAATNYSAGYYFKDALQTWFNPRIAGMLDMSPYSRSFAITGSFPTVIDATRGHVVSDDSTAFVTVSNPDITKLDVANYTSYTKSLWLNKTAPGTSQLISPASGSGQDRLIWDSSEHITIDHNNVTYIDYPGMPAATWVMVTATYNAVTHVLRLYINGAPVAFQSSVPAASSHAGLKLLAGWSGLVDDCRMYLRCLSVEDVNELFLRTFM